MNLVDATSVSKEFAANGQNGIRVPAVRDLTLGIREGELVTIFGPNGCGKSTLLNLFAGLLKPDSGSISHSTAGDSPISVGYVFQNYADTLLPWRTVRDNIALPLEIRELTFEAQTERVHQVLRQFRLEEYAEKFIYELSGGLKQLVSIARSVAYGPKLLLLDEPFSALDYSLSRRLWLRFREVWMDEQAATLFVSHNIDEAVFLGDRVCVLSARPARVVAEVVIPFGRRRELSLLSSPIFFDVRSQVLDAFERGQQR